MIRSLRAVAVCVAFLASAATAAAIPPGAEARVAAAWQRAVDAGFSGAVRIDVGGRTVLRAGAGLADPVSGRAFTAETPFEIGSLTKPFTAAAILKLQDQGRLRTTDTLAAFFPDVPADKAAITLRQLLSHSSGLPEVGTVPVGDREPVDRGAFLARVLATPLAYAPGQGFAYSNDGYGVLAAVVEIVSGQSYETFLRTHVLAPAGADAIGYRSAYDEAATARTRDGQTVSACCWGEGGPHWNLIGNGGLVATLDDFVRWRRAFAAGEVVSAAAAREAVSRWAGHGEQGEGYGWMLATSPARGALTLAAGGNPYFVTEMRHYADHDVTTLITTNAQDPLPAVMASLLDAVFATPAAAPAAVVETVAGTPAEEALARGFAQALLADADARRTFLAANAGPRFVESVGLEAIQARADAIHATLAGAEVLRLDYRPPAQVDVVFRGSDGSERSVRLTFGGSPSTPRVAGFEAR